MREKTLYERVKDSEAYGLLYGINHQLLMILPDGARNHRLSSLRSRVILRMDMIKEGHYLPLAATISDYRRQDSKSYKFIIGVLERAEREFKLNPEMVMHPASVEEEVFAVA